MTPTERARKLKPKVRSPLIRWFDSQKRDLPWRDTKNPYAIWVSEVMLQQTQCERVARYWTKFLQRFPTVEILAASELQDVLAQWKGLGYYSRARNLHLAAKEVVSLFGGRLPDSVEALLTLPGFGRYTAGAVASIAFGLEAPLVDGNVARVLCRLLELEGSPGDRSREASLWAAAEVLVNGVRPGDWNQALMELGATVCLPLNPKCADCPVRRACSALATGRIGELPPPRKATPRKRLELALMVARRGDEVLLARREEKGLLGGLWELPSSRLTPGRDGRGSLQELLGDGARVGPELSVVERTLTHRQLVLRLHGVEFRRRLTKPPTGYVEWRWTSREETALLGMSSAMERALAEANACLDKKKSERII